MKKKLLSALIASSVSTAALAGTMGKPVPQHLLMLGGGVAYSHTFYKNNYVAPETFAVTTPSGSSVNPDRIYGSDFFGGYLNASFYACDWLLNATYDLYGKKSKHYTNSNDFTWTTSIAPARFSVTADRVFGDITDLSMGVGVGAVYETVNEGSVLLGNPAGSLGGFSLGNSRIDPVVEAFVMQQFLPNWNAKFNIAYQIPAHTGIHNGDLLLNLGVNYVLEI